MTQNKLKTALITALGTILRALVLATASCRDCSSELGLDENCETIHYDCFEDKEKAAEIAAKTLGDLGLLMGRPA